MSEIIVERTTERKVSKPAPYTDEMLGMIERFRGLNKEEMIKKYNSSDCSPSWTPYQRRVAKAAMLLILKGEVPLPVPKKTELTELDDEIDLAIQRGKPKSVIELDLEKELRKAKIPVIEQKDDGSHATSNGPNDELKEEEVKLPIGSLENKVKPEDVKVVEGRKRGRPLRDLIPENKKK